jgi:hypothetical protein
MDARTVEMVAAALGHEPPSDLRRQVLAGLGPAHTAHLVAQTQAADNGLCAVAHKPLNVVYTFMLRVSHLLHEALWGMRSVLLWPES